MSTDTQQTNEAQATTRSVECSALLPCPFCGEAPHLSERKDVIGRPVYYLRCKNEGCGVMPAIHHPVMKPELAVAVWNDRAR